MNTFRTITAGPDYDRIKHHRGFGEARDYALCWIGSGSAFVVVVDETDNDRLTAIFRATSYDQKRKRWNWESLTLTDV